MVSMRSCLDCESHGMILPSLGYLIGFARLFESRSTRCAAMSPCSLILHNALQFSDDRTSRPQSSLARPSNLVTASSPFGVFGRYSFDVPLFKSTWLLVRKR